MNLMQQKDKKRIIFVIRSVLYAGWLSVCYALFFLLIPPMMENPGDETCADSLAENAGIYNIAIPHYCAFTSSFYIRTYLAYLFIYFLFDVWRREICGFNPSVRMRCFEIAGLCLVYIPLFMNLREPFISFVGTLQFLGPLFLLAIGARFLTKKAAFGMFTALLIFWMIAFFGMFFILSRF